MKKKRQELVFRKQRIFCRPKSALKENFCSGNGGGSLEKEAGACEEISNTPLPLPNHEEPGSHEGYFLRFVLWAKRWSVLCYVLPALEKKVCLLGLGEGFSGCWLEPLAEDVVTFFSVLLIFCWVVLLLLGEQC